jgi:uncharacterized protein YndB with AHSA1/START domain
MDLKDGDIYPKYSFRLTHAEKEWLDRELEALKAKFNAGGSHPVVTKNVLLMTALKRGLRFLRDGVHSRCVQKNLRIDADPARVFAWLTDPRGIATAWTAKGATVASEPNELLAFTWREPSWADADETVCSIRLRRDQDGGTRLELVHSGWEIFPGDEMTAQMVAAGAEWDRRLAELAAHTRA